jgi:hypothetical protein
VGVVAAVIAVAVIAGVVVLVKGSSGTGSGHAASGSAASRHGRAHHSHVSSQASEPSTPAVSPAETQVIVLNGTGSAGLAHRLSTSLQEGGYSQATPQNGAPPGTVQTTVVEYAPGHRAEAAGVAHALGVSKVQVIEGSVASLAGSAKVVVVAGLDKATPAGTGEASSGAATSSSPSPSSNEAAP